MRVLSLVLLLTEAVMAHGFHSSLATFDYVTRSHSLQMVLVANAGDLEGLLRAQTGRPVEIDRTADAEKLTAAYVASNVQIRSEGRQIPLRWVGMEVKTNFVYIYAEATVPSLERLEIRDGLLHDLLPDQVNMMTLRRDGTGKPFDCLFQKGADYALVKQ